jgi:plastocyanin
MRPLRPLALAVTASALLAACGSSSSSTATSSSRTTSTTPRTAPAQSSARVAIRNYMFMPADVTVKAGARVTFTNYDQTAHTATSETSGFDTGTIDPGKSVTVTIKKPGTYTYHCLFHAFMVAHITVVQ